MRKKSQFPTSKALNRAGRASTTLSFYDRICEAFEVDLPAIREDQNYQIAKYLKALSPEEVNAIMQGVEPGDTAKVIANMIENLFKEF